MCKCIRDIESPIEEIDWISEKLTTKDEIFSDQLSDVG
jgi:hypothetical protein